MSRYYVKIEGRTICIRIPDLVIDQRFNNLTPVLLEPQPQHWIEDSSLDIRVRDDLVTLAIINRLAKTLDPTIQAEVNNGLNRAIEQVKIPENVSLELS